MSRWHWKIAWQSFVEGLAFLLPWLIFPLVVALLLLVPQLIEPFCRTRSPIFIALLRLSQVAAGGISLGALIAALAGFAVKQWEWARKELQEEVQQTRASIAEMRMLLQRRQLALGLRRYRLCRQSKEAVWLVERVRDELERTWKENAPAELRQFQHYCDQLVLRGTSQELHYRVGTKDVRRAAETLLWASQNLSGNDYEQATKMMAALLNPETVAEVASVILKHEYDEGVRAWLRDDRFRTAISNIAGQDYSGLPSAIKLLNVSMSPTRRPPLWRKERPRDPEDILAAMAGLDLKINPFGPPKAEEDPLLPEFWVQPPGWEKLYLLNSALVVAPLGSGKTATALHLTYEWQENLSLRDDCFPIYAGHLAALERNETWLNRLACQLGEKLVAFVGHNPYAFLEQKPGGQFALSLIHI